MSDKRDVVLFLGAGFSHDGALPTMNGFGNESEKQLSSNTVQLDLRRASAMFRQAGTIFHQFQAYCEKNKVVTLDPKNMEEVFCVAEALNEAGVKFINLEGQTILVENLIKQIQLWLWKIYQQCPPLNDARESEVSRESYEHFMDSIDRKDLASRITVLTTNYDLLFEHFALSKGIKCLYPFKSGTFEIIKTGTRDEVFVSAGQNDDGILVCKLHGSVNFFKEGLLGLGKLGVSNDVTFPDDQIGLSGTPHPKRPAVFAFDAIWNLRQKYGDVVPAIIPPTYAKLRQEAWLQDTWNEAINSLSCAKKIIFIGYSLPQTDGFVKAMLQAAFTLRDPGTSYPIIYAVDPDEDGKVFRRYEGTFTQFKLKENFFKIKFSEFISTDKFEEILAS